MKSGYLSSVVLLAMLVMPLCRVSAADSGDEHPGYLSIGGVGWNVKNKYAGDTDFWTGWTLAGGGKRWGFAINRLSGEFGYKNTYQFGRETQQTTAKDTDVLVTYAAANYLTVGLGIRSMDFDFDYFDENMSVGGNDIIEGPTVYLGSIVPMGSSGFSLRLGLDYMFHDWRTHEDYTIDDSGEFWTADASMAWAAEHVYAFAGYRWKRFQNVDLDFSGALVAAGVSF